MYYRGVSKCVDCHVPVQKKILSVQITITNNVVLLTLLITYLYLVSCIQQVTCILYNCIF